MTNTASRYRCAYLTTMKLSGAIAAICLASASAFAPAPVSRVSFAGRKLQQEVEKGEDFVGDAFAWNHGINHLAHQPLVVESLRIFWPWMLLGGYRIGWLLTAKRTFILIPRFDSARLVAVLSVCIS